MAKKKTKGKKKKFPVFYVVIIIAVVCLALIILLKNIPEEEFNPETDICNEYYDLYSYEEINEQNAYDCQDTYEYLQFKYSCKICKSWHPKTFCEKCLDVPYDKWHRNAINFIDEEGFCEEKCKCEEYRYKKIPNPEWFYNCCVLINENLKYAFFCVPTISDEWNELISVSMSDSNIGSAKSINYSKCKETQRYIKEKDVCTSAIPKTPCQKNEEGWIEDLECESISFGCGYLMNESNPDFYGEYIDKCCKTICRQKTSSELYKDYLNSFDCKKLFLDFSEDCAWKSKDCKHDYYKETNTELQIIFGIMGCEVE